MNKILLLVAAMTIVGCSTGSAEEHIWGTYDVEFKPSDVSESSKVSDESLVSFCLESRDYFTDLLQTLDMPGLQRQAYEVLFELVDGSTMDRVSQMSHYKTMLDRLTSGDEVTIKQNFHSMISRDEYKQIFGGLIVACRRIPEIHRHFLNLLANRSRDLAATGCKTATRVENIDTLCSIARPRAKDWTMLEIKYL